MTPNYAATFSDVYPIPNKQSLAHGWSKIASLSNSAFIWLYISYIVIYSTPAPIPISNIPDLILAAITAHASIPDEQNLLIAVKHVVSGNPDKKAAILDTIAPLPGWLTLPTTMS